jgi:hypothetical protein
MEPLMRHSYAEAAECCLFPIHLQTISSVGSVKNTEDNAVNNVVYSSIIEGVLMLLRFHIQLEFYGPFFSCTLLILWEQHH